MLRHTFTRSLFLGLFAALLLSSCQAASGQTAALITTPSPGATTTRQTPVPPSAATLAATATQQPTAAPSVWLAPYLPDKLRQQVQLPDSWQTTEQAETASYTLDVLPNGVGRSEAPAGSVAWVYALAAPFPTVADSVTLVDLEAVWHGSVPENAPFKTLLVDSSTRGVFEQHWGAPGARVQTVPAEKILDLAWAGDTSWVILPFEQLEPRWKVIAVDNQNPVQKTFDAAQYGLTVYFGLSGPLDQSTNELFSTPLADSNRRADHLTTVMLTGTTALVRGTASLMEYYGNDYPATFIGDTLREADILHISNEVAFAKNCPDPYPWTGLAFCSRTKYIELLESIGTDVIDLSGDHFQDWGKDAMLLTLDMYQERGWPVYAGGRNLAEAEQPALFEHNGNKIAFLGCNAKPPGYASAGEDSPGAIHCDFDELVQAIQKVRAEGYLPIVTFQHLEYYRYDAHPILQADFKRVAEAGAIIISGSQAHQPQAMTFLDAVQMETDPDNTLNAAPPDLSFLHYGLGNLFFDQYLEGFPERQAFIDRHVIYEGRHISTELLTILFIDLARARPMTLEERQDLLTTIFKASGWQK